MLNFRATIERPAENRLTSKVWEFALLDREMVLDDYYEMARESTRHKLKVVRKWRRLNQRDNDIEIAQVPFPEDVPAEAKQKLLDYIRDEIPVLKERE